MSQENFPSPMQRRAELDALATAANEDGEASNLREGRNQKHREGHEAVSRHWAHHVAEALALSDRTPDASERGLLPKNAAARRQVGEALLHKLQYEDNPREILEPMLRSTEPKVRKVAALAVRPLVDEPHQNRDLIEYVALDPEKFVRTEMADAVSVVIAVGLADERFIELAKSLPFVPNHFGECDPLPQSMFTVDNVGP